LQENEKREKNEEYNEYARYENGETLMVQQHLIIIIDELQK